MSRGPQPPVTIITPAFNRADYLGGVIDSVLGQDYPDLEYIVIDDGSTDGTPELLRRYEGRIVALSHPNMGEGRTVNRGLALARGAIVAVVNSDDPLRPGAVRKIVARMESEPGLLVVYPDWDVIDADGRTIDTVRTPDYRYLDMVRWHRSLPGPATFFRRGILDRIGGRDPQYRYIADYDFWLRAGLLGPFARLPEAVATFRVHGHSTSVREKGSAMAEEHLRLVRNFYSRDDLGKDVRRVRREAESSARYVAGCVTSRSEPAEARRHFRAALALAPGKYLGEYRGRLPAMLEVLSPGLWGAARRAKRAILGCSGPARAV